MPAAPVRVDFLLRSARPGARRPDPGSIAATHDFEGAAGDALWPHCRRCLEPAWFHKPLARPGPVPRGPRTREVIDPRREPALAPTRRAASTP